MDYNLALQCEIAIVQIKNGLNIEENIKIIEEGMKPIIENEKAKHQKKLRNVNLSYANFDPLVNVSRAIAALSNGSALHLEALREVRKREDETQDILHAIELGEVTDDQIYEYGRELQEIRKIRRTAKNFSEISKPIYSFNEKHPEAIADLKRLHGDMTKIQNAIKNRVYTPRVKTTMEVAFESIQEKLLKNEQGEK